MANAEYRIYKPRLDQAGKPSGSATKWEAGWKDVKGANGKTYKEIQMFVTGTNQGGTGKEENAVFDWKTTKNPTGKQVLMKLGDADVGEILAVLGRHKDKLGGPAGSGLFHKNPKNPKASSTLQIEFAPSRDTKQYDPNFKLRLSFKDEKSLVIVQNHIISLGEAEILRNLLEGAIRRKYSP
jgi:hypothetical protein